MLKQLINTLRNFKNRPLLVFVSIPGLAIGLTAFMILMIYVKHEMSYDNHFSTKERVVRLYNTVIDENSSSTYPISLRSAYTIVPTQIPEIELTAQLYRGGDFKVRYGENQFDRQTGLYTDAEFFNVFGLDLITGNKDNALAASLSVVLTESLANKLFNSVECVGKIIETKNQKFTVTGVVEDLPANTHFNFDLLLSINTIKPDNFGGLEFFTYYLLHEDANFELVDQKISSVYNAIITEKFCPPFQEIRSGIERLPDLHLFSVAQSYLSEKGNVKNLYILGFLAAFILLIAIINTINSFVLYGEKRSLEIGIRKSLGAGKGNLRKLFYFETAVLCITAFVLAFIVTYAITPLFAEIINKKFTLSILFDAKGIIGIITFLILLIFICGAYPSLYLSKLNTIDTIKGGSNTIQRKKVLSIAAVLTQFSISVFLIICLLVIVSQVTYLKKVPLGFNVDNVIGISGFDNTIMEKSKSIKAEMLNLPFVSSFGTSSHYMGGGTSGQFIYEYGESEKDVKTINEYRIQEGFCETMELQLASGRFYSGTDADKQSIVINQAAVDMMGLGNAVGKYLVMHTDPLKIIGVVKNFYYNDNAGEKIAPLALSGGSNRPRVFYVKVKGEIGEFERQKITDILSQFDENYIPNIFVLKDTYSRKFWKEDQLIELLLYGTLLAIFLSFAGMFSLSVFNVEKRTKEIGIRKVMGSSSKEVLVFLLGDMLKWVLWSMIPAFLAAYLLMSDWLMGYAVGIDLGVYYFIVSGFMALLIAFVAISVQSYTAATRNPVDSLRYE